MTDRKGRLWGDSEDAEGEVPADALLVALTESLNEGVVAIDSHMRVVRINETGRQLLNLSEAVPFSSDRLPHDRSLRDALDTALSGVDASPCEVHVGEYTLLLTTRPLPGGGAVLAFYDLTPTRRLEAVRRDFVANVSHELRTPITVIGGFLETLRDEQLSPELRAQFLDIMEASVRRMQRIVDDLLDLSRIESGGWLPDPTEMDTASLAGEVFAPLQHLADSKGLLLQTAIAAGAESIHADPTAARQILANLAENALRHTQNGSVTLVASPDGDGIWVGVRDTGAGIPAEHLSRVFERFYRADPARSREAGGTGLGLAIVRHLAEAHGGRVRAESTPGSGTTIEVWLPNAESVEPTGE